MSAFCHCFTNVSHATSQRKITVGMIMKLEMLAEGTHCYHTESEVDSTANMCLIDWRYILKILATFPEI